MASYNHLKDLEKCMKSCCNDKQVKDEFEVKDDKSLFVNVTSPAVSRLWDGEKWFRILSYVSCFIVVSLTLWNIHLFFKLTKLQTEHDELKQLVTDYVLKNKDSSTHSQSEHTFDGKDLQDGILHSKRGDENNHTVTKRDIEQEEFRKAIDDDDISMQRPERSSLGRSIVLQRSKRSGRRRGKHGKNNRGNNRNKKGNKNKNKQSKEESRNRIVNIYLKSTGSTKFHGSKFIDWTPSDQHQSSIFTYNDGEVTINQDGVYTVYGQITYHTAFPTVSYSIKRKLNNESNETISKCLNHVAISADNASNAPSNRNFVHCYTSKTLSLKNREKIYVTDDYGVGNINQKRQVRFLPAETFWGIHLVKT